MSDESDTEDQPDEWKKNRTLPPGARDQMRNYANKRGTNIKFMKYLKSLVNEYVKFCFQENVIKFALSSMQQHIYMYIQNIVF